MSISVDKPDLILLTEVIPKAQKLPISQALLSIDGYSLFLNFDASSPNLGAGGKRGIGAFVANHLNTLEVTLTHQPLIEQLWLQVSTREKCSLLLGCVYRSPSVDLQDSTKQLEFVFQEATSMNYSHLLITGDFNLPQINWDLGSSSASDGHPSHAFVEMIQSCYLYQHVREPTRFRVGEIPNVLDLIFSNEEGMVKNLEHLPGLGTSDHVMMRFDLVNFSRVVKHELKVHTNCEDLVVSLSNIDWTLMQNMDLDESYDFFKHNLTESIKRCSVTKKPKPMRNLYFTREAWRLRKKKNKLWAIYSQSQDLLDHARFSRCRNDLRKLTRHLRKEFEKNLALQMKANPKAFWRYASSRLSTRCRIEALTTKDGITASTGVEKAEALSKYFASQFTAEGPGPLPVMPECDVTALCDIDISPDVVKQKLASLKPSSSPGPDTIHPRVLYDSSTALAGPLCTLFRKSLDSGKVPPDWQLGEVVPIFKKGSRHNPANYRPVSLTAVPSKVLESLVRDKIIQHVLESELLHPSQHGFLPKRSCATQLIEVIEEWSAAADARVPVDVAYLDFCKAFDSVPHKRLLLKLHGLGIRGKLLSWIEAFLTERRQRVVVEGCRSDWVSVASGIPQGSVLGPTLFILYVNDIPDQLLGEVRMFADDTKVYRRVPRPMCPRSFQADLHALEKWSQKWLLNFNVSKCKIMHLGYANPHVPYFLNGIEVEEVGLEKDRGIIVDRELKFHEQTAAAVSKASQMLAVVKRSFANIDASTLPLIYKAIVRPHLEYCNVVWGPFGKLDQQRLERVQRRATRLVRDIRERPYERRLQILQLPSLYYRRRRGDMIMVYQMLNGHVSLGSENLLKTCDLATHQVTRGHEWKLCKPRARTALRKHSFSHRVVKDWNSLPTDVVSANNIAQFKARLDHHWSHIMYTVPQ